MRVSDLLLNGPCYWGRLSN